MLIDRRKTETDGSEWINFKESSKKSSRLDNSAAQEGAIGGLITQELCVETQEKILRQKSSGVGDGTSMCAFPSGYKPKASLVTNCSLSSRWLYY